MKSIGKIRGGWSGGRRGWRNGDARKGRRRLKVKGIERS